ncbi:hypothetical protein JCM10207_003973 [Rhodosporidiobolus poonsookiae]
MAIRTLSTAVRALRVAPQAPLAFRGFATSMGMRKSVGEGVGEKKSIGGDNPVSARLKGVGKAAKGVAEGAAGAAEAAAGEQVPSDKRQHVAGADSRDVQQQAKDEGKKEGLAKGHGQQGSI